MTTQIEVITKYGYAYVIPSISIFGIVCNIVNLTVLTSRRLKESPYTYLKFLATFDLLTLTLALITTFSRSQDIWFHDENVLREYVLKKMEKNYFLPTANVCSAMSVWITVALTIERYLFTKFPMHASTYCCPKYARIIILILFVLVLLFRIPMYFFLQVTYIKESYNQTNFLLNDCIYDNYTQICNNSTNYTTFVRDKVVVSTRLDNNIIYIYFLCSFLIFQIIPFFVLLFLNISLIIMVRKANKESNKMRKLSIVSSSTSANYSVNDSTINTNTSNQFNNPSVMIYNNNNNNNNHNTQSNNIKNNYKVGNLMPIQQSMKSKREKDQLKLTRTLIAVIFIALFSESSSILTYEKITNFLIGQHIKNYMRTTYEFQKFISFCIVLIAQSVNFFLYCAFNRKYLQIFRMKYSFCWKVVNTQRKWHSSFFRNKNANDCTVVNITE